MRQNARPILALAGFKCVLSVINYQEFMTDPSEALFNLTRLVV